MESTIKLGTSQVISIEGMSGVSSTFIKCSDCNTPIAEMLHFPNGDAGLLIKSKHHSQRHQTYMKLV